MFTVLTCVTEQHNLTLVGLAGLICFLASLCAMVLLDRAMSSDGAARWVWIGTAGAAGVLGSGRRISLRCWLMTPASSWAIMLA